MCVLKQLHLPPLQNDFLKRFLHTYLIQTSLSNKLLAKASNPLNDVHSLLMYFNLDLPTQHQQFETQRTEYYFP